VLVVDDVVVDVVGGAVVLGDAVVEVVGACDVLVVNVVEVVGACDVLVVSVVVVVGPAHVPSSAQASFVLKNPSMAPQGLPLHFAAFPTIEALILPFFFSTQHTAAFGFPQIEAFSHCMMSLRHGLSGIRAVRFASFRVDFTHFL